MLGWDVCWSKQMAVRHAHFMLFKYCTFTCIHLLANDTDKIVLYIKRSMASDKVCVAFISPDDLVFVFKVSDAVVAQSIFCAGIHLTA